MIEHRPPDGPHVFIQWKGTEVCMDVYCACGAHGHIDATFAYFLKCVHCGRIYETGIYLAITELAGENRASVERGEHIEPIEFSDDDLEVPPKDHSK